MSKLVCSVTMARRWYPKSCRDIVLGCLLALSAAGVSGAAATERIVIDARTGLAIEGIDPVSYFLGEPREGVPDVELTWRGAIFRFTNQGNREAFQAHPERYMPLFGGHDPVSIARGFVARGDPMVAALHQDRLILFFSVEARERFLADTDTIMRQAARNWPRLELTLSR
jgi:hypothetical protein